MKLKNLICDETPNTQIVIKLKNIKIVMKPKNSNGDKTEKLKM